MGVEAKKSLAFLLPAIAIGSSLIDSARYAHTLQINHSEWNRYFKKSANLAMCYSGFAQDISIRQAQGAGHAAFLSCAYDVVTDWGKDAKLQSAYTKILEAETTATLTKMAMDLLDRDVNGVLLDDGLERGIVATEFVLQMMGIRRVYERKCDIRQLGLNLQIVDDVLDYEGDVAQGDQNCLTNAVLRKAYLKRLPNDLSDLVLDELFPYGGILTIAIRMARNKAENMLAVPEKYFST